MSGALLQIQDVAGRARVDDDADVVIIGSGAAGATAARVLTEAGLDVVVIEEGPHLPAERLRSDLYSSLQGLWRDMGMQVAKGRAFAPILQGSCVGGTTAINGAIVHRLPEAVEQQWKGQSELLTLRELERVYDRLDRELSVGRAPEEVLGDSAKLMREGARRLGIPGNEIRRNVRECRGSGHCNQGCPTGQKQSMNVSFIPRAIAAGARVYATCRAGKLLTARGRAAGVLGRFCDRATGRPGPTLRVNARRAVVVAASAIQTPIFLQANGLGGRHVGRHLQAHPGVSVVGVFDRPVDLWFGATQAYETMHFWNDGMKLETVGMPLELAAARMPEMGPALMRSMAAFGHAAIWGAEVRARAEGRVRRGPFGGTAITYDLSDEDVRTMKRGIQRVVHLMFAAGAREVLPGVHGLPDRIRSPRELERIHELPDDPRLVHFIAAHLFGTARIGPDASAGVVGPDLEAHDLPGLYVFDSSVFPSNIGVNPQHTISAVSWLAAERLAARRVC